MRERKEREVPALTCRTHLDTKHELESDQIEVKSISICDGMVRSRREKNVFQSSIRNTEGF